MEDEFATELSIILRKGLNQTIFLQYFFRYFEKFLIYTTAHNGAEAFHCNHYQAVEEYRSIQTLFQNYEVVEHFHHRKPDISLAIFKYNFKFKYTVKAL